MLIAQRNLTREKTRLALSIGGVALAIMLVLILDGLLAGMYRQITSYLDHTPGSVVVAQKGVRNLLGATSLLPVGAAADVEAIDGVAEAVPILSQFVVLDLHGKKQPTYLVGYSPELGGGPWDVVAGRTPETGEEMVFDRVLAARHDIGLGDEVALMDRSYSVVGLSRGTTSWMTSFIFLRQSAVQTLVRAPGAASFLLVEVEKEEAAESVRDRISELPGVEALLKSDVQANDRRLFGKFFSAPVRLMAGIAFLIGALVVGQVIYTATVERRREYGVLKALGARNRVLYSVVLIQALWSALAGTAFGILLALGARTAIMAARPQFLIVLQADMAGRALLIGLGMGLLAAFFPARAIAGLEPAEVFRR